MRTVGIVLFLLIVLSVHESGCSDISSVPATVCFLLHDGRALSSEGRGQHNADGAPERPRGEPSCRVSCASLPLEEFRA